ncbi:hypothetical protein B0H17DRAFT_1125606 [Mycena rosella]|uniref:Uncharacterized protein n=1 Tax=Mycena rosella TaxID=1033263 RepID=A0AAD7GWJ0_MYCRO|nr:hypothetical protein B0H17DRAFT_1125606 [Mycena rosella]
MTGRESLMSISWSRAGEWFAGSTRDAACTGELREEAGLLIEELEAEPKPELEDEASEAGELNIFLGGLGLGGRGRELAWLDGLIYMLGPEKKRSGRLRSESGEMSDVTLRRCHPRLVGDLGAAINAELARRVITEIKCRRLERLKAKLRASIAYYSGLAHRAGTLAYLPLLHLHRTRPSPLRPPSPLPVSNFTQLPPAQIAPLASDMERDPGHIRTESPTGPARFLADLRAAQTIPPERTRHARIPDEAYDARDSRAMVAGASGPSIKFTPRLTLTLTLIPLIRHGPQYYASSTYSAAGENLRRVEHGIRDAANRDFQWQITQLPAPAKYGPRRPQTSHLLDSKLNPRPRPARSGPNQLAVLCLSAVVRRKKYAVQRPQVQTLKHSTHREAVLC